MKKTVFKHRSLAKPASRPGGFKTLVFFLGAIALLGVTVYGASTIQNLYQNASTTILRYEKFELTYQYTGNYNNPNDPSQADVEAVFISPTGKKQTVPGFYYESYANDTPTGNKNWKVRFAPSEIGNYTYTVTLKDGTGLKTLDSNTFTVSASQNHGFVRGSGVTYVFDDGTPFFPLGINAKGFHQIAGGEGGWICRR